MTTSATKSKSKKDDKKTTTKAVTKAVKAIQDKDKQADIDTRLAITYNTAKKQYSGMNFAQFKPKKENDAGMRARAIYNILAYIHHNKLGEIVSVGKNYSCAFHFNLVYQIIEKFTKQSYAKWHKSDNPIAQGMYSITKPATNIEQNNKGEDLPDYFGVGELAGYRERTEGNEEKARPLRLDSGYIFTIHSRDYEKVDDADMTSACKLLDSSMKRFIG